MINVDIAEPEAAKPIEITHNGGILALTEKDAATLADLLSQSLQDIQYERNGKAIEYALQNLEEVTI